MYFCTNILFIFLSIRRSSWSYSGGSSGGFGNESGGFYGSGGGDSFGYGRGDVASENQKALGGGYVDFGGYTPNLGDMQAGAHSSGMGSHRGDEGAGNIMVARDVVHHGDGSVFVQEKGKGKGPIPTMNVEDIHNAINKAIMDAHGDEIARKNMQLKENQLQKALADEKARARADQINMLKDLDRQATALEQQKPEVLDKKAIPVVNFTEDTYPLRHHIKAINKKKKMIESEQQKLIRGQNKLAKLDDITDKFVFNNSQISNPKLLNQFVKLGGADALRMEIPVLENDGSYYINGNAGHGSHDNGGHVGENLTHSNGVQAANGHTHFNDHGYHVPGSGLSGSVPGQYYGNENSYANFYQDALPYNMNDFDGMHY